MYQIGNGVQFAIVGAAFNGAGIEVIQIAIFQIFIQRDDPAVFCKFGDDRSVHVEQIIIAGVGHCFQRKGIGQFRYFFNDNLHAGSFLKFRHMFFVPQRVQTAFLGAYTDSNAFIGFCFGCKAYISACK